MSGVNILSDSWVIQQTNNKKKEFDTTAEFKRLIMCEGLYFTEGWNVFISEALLYKNTVNLCYIKLIDIH